LRKSIARLKSGSKQSVQLSPPVNVNSNLPSLDNKNPNLNLNSNPTYPYPSPDSPNSNPNSPNSNPESPNSNPSSPNPNPNSSINNNTETEKQSTAGDTKQEELRDTDRETSEELKKKVDGLKEYTKVLEPKLMELQERRDYLTQQLQQALALIKQEDEQREKQIAPNVPLFISTDY